MDVINQSRKSQVFDTTIIEPGGAGTLPEGFEDNPHVKVMLGTGAMAEIGRKAKPRRAEPTKTLTEVAETEEAETPPISELETDVDTVIEKWAATGVPECKAWIKTCGDGTVLARMLPFEKRKGVAAALKARITRLQQES